MNKQIQIWQHNASGEVYAVETDKEGNVTAAAGPLHRTEVQDAREGNINWDHEVTEDVQADPDRYCLKESN